MTKPPETPYSRTTPESAQAMMDEFLNSHNAGTAAEWSDNVANSFENAGAGAIFNNPGHLGAGISAIGDIADGMPNLGETIGAGATIGDLVHPNIDGFPFSNNAHEPISPSIIDTVGEGAHLGETIGAGATIGDIIHPNIDGLPFSNNAHEPISPSIIDAVGEGAHLGATIGAGAVIGEFSDPELLHVIKGDPTSVTYAPDATNMGDIAQSVAQDMVDVLSGTMDDSQHTPPPLDFVSETAQEAFDAVSHVMGTGANAPESTTGSPISQEVQMTGSAMAAVASGLGNDVKMDTDTVKTVADNIAILNGDMKDRFNELSKTVDKLHGSWEGKAAETCIGKFKDMDSAYSESRYTVINNVVLFLKQQIGEGYEETEKANVSLADYFK